MIGWLTTGFDGARLYAAFSFSASTYFPLALLAVLLTVLLIKAVRLWQEIHEVEEPVTSDDLLATFEQAHAEGELDDDEFAKVREQLGSGSTLDRGATSISQPRHGGAAGKQTGPSDADLDERAHLSAERETVREE
jgi:hypothetical protein